MNRTIMQLEHVMVGQKWTTQRDKSEYWIRTKKVNDRGEPISCNANTGELKPHNQLMQVSAVTSSAFEPIPSWLPALRERLQKQDNRGTSFPLFIVEQVLKVYGKDVINGEHETEWYQADDDHNIYKSDAELLVGVCMRGLSVAKRGIVSEGLIMGTFELDGVEYTRLYYKEVWKFETAHFTELGAQRYIDENGHNMTRTRIYTTSQHRCPEWNAVRDWLAGTIQPG